MKSTTKSLHQNQLNVHARQQSSLTWFFCHLRHPEILKYAWICKICNAVVVCRAHMAKAVESTILNNITMLSKLSQTLQTEITSSAATQPFSSPNSCIQCFVFFADTQVLWLLSCYLSILYFSTHLFMFFCSGKSRAFQFLTPDPNEESFQVKVLHRKRLCAA